MVLHTQTRLWINGGLVVGAEVFHSGSAGSNISVIIHHADIIRKTFFLVHLNLIPAAPPQAHAGGSAAPRILRVPRRGRPGQAEAAHLGKPPLLWPEDHSWPPGSIPSTRNHAN